MPRPQPPTVALIGRTNVGKSTLFNRLSETKKALVSRVAGTTRDRQEALCLWRGKVIKLIDTGGLDVSRSDEIEKNVIKQAELAMKQADFILFVVDLSVDPLPQELELARMLLKTKKPVLVVGNKAETRAIRLSAQQPQWRLAGLPAPFPISALRGSGTGDLLDEIYKRLREQKTPPIDRQEIEPIKIAVIGKPNVGKSSLLNALLREERFIVSNISHTTREPTDVLVETDDDTFLFIDTAGIRKKGKVRKSGGLEAAGVERSRKAIENADVALLVLDINEPIGSQDRTLAGELKETRAGVIVVANKWDLIKEKGPSTINAFHKLVEAYIPFLSWAPILFTSALNHQRTDNVFDLVKEVQTNRHRKFTQDELEAFLKRAMKHHNPKRGKGPKPPAILGLKQIGVAPPTFELVVKAKREDVLHPSWVKYLENQLHDQFGLKGTPIRIRIKLPSVRGRV